MATLTEEVLDEIDPNVDFSQYDANNDGYVDQIFIMLRSGPNWSGYSILGDVNAQELQYDGISIDWNLSGSYNRWYRGGNIYPELNQTRLLAHEFGHDLWTNSLTDGKHILPLGNISSGSGGTGVPENGPSRLGYALMVGGSTYDARGDLTISAWERDILNDGWISCPVLSTDATVTLRNRL